MSRQLNLSLNEEDKRAINKLRRLIEKEEDNLSYIDVVRQAVRIATDSYIPK